MDLKCLWELIKGRWREFTREPSAFFFVFIMPIIWMVLLGYMFSGGGSEHITVGVSESVHSHYQNLEPWLNKTSSQKQIRLLRGSAKELNDQLATNDRSAEDCA